MVNIQALGEKIKQVLVSTRRYLQEKKLLILFCFIGLTLLSVTMYTVVFNRWAQPQDVKVTNIGSNSVTVSWHTSVPTKGSVVYGDSEFLLPWVISKIGRKVACDDRDYAKAELESGQELVSTSSEQNSTLDYHNQEVQVTTQDNYYVHHVTLRNLTPSSTYYFKVGNGALFTEVKSDTGDHEFNTYALTDEIRVPDPIYGKITADGENVTDGTVFVQLSCTDWSYDTVLSAVTNTEGGWYIDLSNARESDGAYVAGLIEEECWEEVVIDGGQYGVTNMFNNSMVVDAPMGPVDLSNDVEDSEEEASIQSGLVAITWAKVTEGTSGSKTTKKKDPTPPVQPGSPAVPQEKAPFTGGGHDKGGAKAKAAAIAEAQSNNDDSESAKAPSDDRTHGVASPSPQDWCDGVTTNGSCNDLTTTCYRTGENGDIIERSFVAVWLGKQVDVTCCQIRECPEGWTEEKPSAVNMCEDMGCDGLGECNYSWVCYHETSGAEIDMQAGTKGTCTTSSGDLINCCENPACPAGYSTTPPLSVIPPVLPDNDIPEWVETGIVEVGAIATGCVSGAVGGAFLGAAGGFGFGAIPGAIGGCIVGGVAGGIGGAAWIGFSVSDNPADFVLEVPVLGRVFEGNTLNYTSAIYATDTETINATEEYIIVPESGKYQLSFGDYESAEFVTFVEGIKVKFFVDENKNGQFDEGEQEISPEGYKVTVQSTAKLYTYNLQEGLNFISFPYVIDAGFEGNMASELIDHWNGDKETVVYSIAKFDTAKNRWVMVGNREGGAYGSDDFQIVPGRGYLIKMAQNTEAVIAGKEVIKGAPIYLGQGWNLIGVHGTDINKEYTAGELLDAIDVYTDEDTDVPLVDVDNVTRWDLSRAKYDGLQKSVDDSGEVQTYGFDFPLKRLDAYFVRVVDGEDVIKLK